MVKVCQCTSCGQYFDESNDPVGKAVNTKKCDHGSDHEGPIIALVQSSDIVLKRIEEKLDKRIEENNVINREINVIDQQILHLSLANNNAYNNITQSSTSKESERQSNIRTRYYDFCGITSNTAYCVVTGRNGKLKLAHLLPASADRNALNMLKLSNDHNGIWSLRNVLLLSWNLVHHFDQLKLSFLPNPLYSNRYYMKIWDSSIIQEPIFEGAAELNDVGDNLIGYYDGKDINLKVSGDKYLEPFKRCLAYQAFYCCMKLDGVNKFQSDFSSNIGKNEWPTFRNNLIALKDDLYRVIAKETNEEESDDDEYEETEEDEDEVS